MPASPPEKTTLGLDQHLIGALAYLLGPVSAVALLLIESENRFVRFHAFQSLFTWIAIALLGLVSGGLPLIGRLLWVPLFLLSMFLWAFLMYKALMTSATNCDSSATGQSNSSSRLVDL